MSLDRGGTEYTLIQALKCLDLNQYDISLYCLINCPILEKDIDSRVKVKYIDDLYSKEKSFSIKFLSLCIKIADLFKLSRIKRQFEKWGMTCKNSKYKKIREYFKKEDKKYEIAVAYDMSYDILAMVANFVKADYKIAYTHSQRIPENKQAIYRKYNKIVTVNAEVARLARIDMPDIAQKIVAIENYIDPQRIIELAQKPGILSNISLILDYTNTNKICLLCTCGRIAKEKGFDIAVSTACILRDKGIPFHWLFVGGGYYEDEIKKLIKENNLESYITITGFVDNPYVYIKECDIYIQPSKEEAHGITIVESMILNKPIISTNTAGGRYIKRTYGCCSVVEYDAFDLAEEIVRLINDETARNKYLEAETKIDWEWRRKTYSDQINSLFNKE